MGADQKLVGVPMLVHPSMFIVSLGGMVVLVVFKEKPGDSGGVSLSRVLLVHNYHFGMLIGDFDLVDVMGDVPVTTKSTEDDQVVVSIVINVFKISKLMYYGKRYNIGEDLRDMSCVSVVRLMRVREDVLIQVCFGDLMWDTIVFGESSVSSFQRVTKQDVENLYLISELKILVCQIIGDLTMHVHVFLIGNYGEVVMIMFGDLVLI